MKKNTFLLVFTLGSFAATGFAQAVNPVQLSVDQQKVSVIDDANANSQTLSTDANHLVPAEGEVKAFTIDENGNVIGSNFQNPSNKIQITKADYEALPLEKKQFIIDDPKSFIIIE